MDRCRFFVLESFSVRFNPHPLSRSTSEWFQRGQGVKKVAKIRYLKMATDYQQSGRYLGGVLRSIMFGWLSGNEGKNVC